MDVLPLPDLYRVALTQAAENYFGFPAPLPMFVGQMRQESGFNPNAQSHAGAKGLFQFMPATASWAAEAAGFKPAAPLDANWSIKAGIWYMRYLRDRVRGATECDQFLFALSSYNGGLGWTYARQNLSPKPLDWITTAVINPGILDSNQNENVNYPLNIIWRWQVQYRSEGGKTICLKG